MVKEYYESREDAMKGALELIKGEYINAIEIHTPHVTITLQRTQKGWTVTED